MNTIQWHTAVQNILEELSITLDGPNKKDVHWTKYSSLIRMDCPTGLNGLTRLNCPAGLDSLTRMDCPSGLESLTRKIVQLEHIDSFS